MAVSGVTTFTVTRDSMVKTIMRNLQALDPSVEPTSNDTTNISEALNILIKAVAKKGCALWVTQEITIPMCPGVGAYPVGPTAGYVADIVVVSGGTGYTAGTWAAVGGTLGTVASGTYTVSSGAVLAMTVLVPGDSYTADPTSYTLSGAGIGFVGNADIAGYTGSRPLKVLQSGSFIRNSWGNDSTLLQISRQEYDIMGSKSAAGTPNQFYYDVGLVNGTIYLLNVPLDNTSSIHFQIQRQFYDMVSGTDNFDFPQEWFQWLKWAGTAELSLEYAVSDKLLTLIEGKAAKFEDECFGFSVEEASTYFTVDTRGGRG
jgi:hypothetical protein